MHIRRKHVEKERPLKETYKQKQKHVRGEGRGYIECYTTGPSCTTKLLKSSPCDASLVLLFYLASDWMQHRGYISSVSNLTGSTLNVLKCFKTKSVEEQQQGKPR